MARVPYLEMDSLDPMPEDPSPYNPDWASDHNLHRAMANHPEALRVFWSRIGTWLHTKGGLAERLRRFAIIQASYVTANGYEFAHHVNGALNSGALTHEDILAMIDESNGKETDLSAFERSVLKMARDLTLKCEVDDETWAALEAEMDIKDLLELVLSTSYYNHNIRLTAALKITLDDGHAKEIGLKSVLERYPPHPSIGVWR